MCISNFLGVGGMDGSERQLLLQPGKDTNINLVLQVIGKNHTACLGEQLSICKLLRPTWELSLMY